MHDARSYQNGNQSTTNKPHRISKGLTSATHLPLPGAAATDRASRGPRRAASETLAPPPQPWPPSRSRRRWSSPPSRAAPSPPPPSSASRQTSCASSAPRPAATAATSASRRSSPRRGRTAPPPAPTPAAEVSAIPNAKVAQPSAVVQAERNLLGSDASLAVHAGTVPSYLASSVPDLGSMPFLFDDSFLSFLNDSFAAFAALSYVKTGERLGRRIATDAITTPVVNTSAYWFNNSQELIDFKVGQIPLF